MASNVFYERFNEQSYDFMKELSNTFPQIQEFGTFKNALNLVRNVNVKKPQEFFQNFISANYKDVLLNKDESFFLQEEKFGLSDTKEYWYDFIKKLKQIWTTLSDENKEVIWKYFHVLIILSDKCESLKEKNK